MLALNRISWSGGHAQKLRHFLLWLRKDNVADYFSQLSIPHRKLNTVRAIRVN
ncbi:hypothetical protein DFO50_1288 [Microvirgula sp. AG722]|nr:hypothetical protein DFO50_1288 [Microvirgula sp. AG722]